MSVLRIIFIALFLLRAVSSDMAFSMVGDDIKVTASDDITVQLGQDKIELEDATLIRHDLPSKYYPNIDFSTFQPYMSYRSIKRKNSMAYTVSHSENAYTDEYGLRRYRVPEDQFSIGDDYIIALGTYYKDKGACNRFLIVTTTGMYTAITGDEKSDCHTDKHNMFTLHGNGKYAGTVEWVVDTKKLHKSIKTAGTITAGPVEALKGKILYIYKIA